MTPHGFQQVMRAIAASPPPQLLCPLCGFLLDAGRVITVDRPGAGGILWQGCDTCLAAANRRGQHRASSDQIALLLRAKRAITEPTDASEIDALCQAIDLAYLAART
jgi:hypothetical protein